MVRGPRRLLESLRGEPSPAGYDMTACLNVELGCVDCPARRTLIVPALGLAELKTPPGVPITSSLDVKVDGTGRAQGFGVSMKRLGGFAINTESCSGGTVCPNINGIEETARAIETNVEVAASVVDLPVMHLDSVNQTSEIIQKKG